MCNLAWVVVITIVALGPILFVSQFYYLRFSNIGKSSFIGAGAVVVDHSMVPSQSFIKAGSTFYNKMEEKC